MLTTREAGTASSMRMAVLAWLVALSAACDVAWINDGVCQAACNNELYNYDGGDCCALKHSSNHHRRRARDPRCRDPEVLRNKNDHKSSGGRKSPRGVTALLGVGLVFVMFAVACFAWYLTRTFRQRSSDESPVLEGPQPKREASLADLEAADESISRFSSDVATASFAGETCPVCLEALDDGVALRCGHAFHAGCLRPWFAGMAPDAHACPVCRTPCEVPAERDDVEQGGAEAGAGPATLP